MSKQLYYTEQRLEQLTQQQVEGWDGGRGISPADFNSALPFLGNPAVAYTAPAGVYATQLDVGQPETDSMLPAKPPVRVDYPMIIVGALVLYLLVRPLA